MAQYRLKAAKRDADGKPGQPLWDDVIEASSVQEAIQAARRYPVDRFIDNTDYAWLTDAHGTRVWDLKLEEAGENF
ncbi:hypothetical protein [Methylobacterium sp. WL19]|uniref:hypothetical protein n=1 Tax=Methylobacterium sp. WL19 TaxID=2603896 RepID=UPI0011C965B9|nr:hypothetical protein [Methylobacterium sp. WL19]TXN21897.1 hypothetical protein FV220_22565 [Methylobacterium sp. WL19]